MIQNLVMFQDLETTEKEVLTDPDLVEMAEELAERFRVMVWSRDDPMEDKVIEMAEKYFGVLEKLESEDPDVEEALCQAEAFILDKLVILLGPLVIRVLMTGDWR